MSEVDLQNNCVQLFSFCVKSPISYLHCACLILFSNSTACACRENLCILFYFFKIMLTFCENFMKILLYKLWHLFFFLRETLNITFWTCSDCGYTNSKLLNTHALLLSVSLHKAVCVRFSLPSPHLPTPLAEYYHVNSFSISACSFLSHHSLEIKCTVFVLWSSVTRDAFSVQVP